MEWSLTKKDGTGGIRVNCISPGHTLTPMVRKNFEEVPGLKEKWERKKYVGPPCRYKRVQGRCAVLDECCQQFYDGEQPDHRRRAYIVVIHCAVTKQRGQSL